jgi:hypothetical protein
MTLRGGSEEVTVHSLSKERDVICRTCPLSFTNGRQDAIGGLLGGNLSLGTPSFYLI